MPLQKLNTNLSEGERDNGSFLSPIAYDDDAASIHSRSDQDTDSDDDELQSRARNSRELRAADRIVLMEEDELDRLVTDTRKKQDRQRRGSGLAVPNPLSLFRRPSLSQLSSGRNSTDGPGPEKRQIRRARRKHKKQRLLEDAEHGEDGELMYEMESGAIKEGSSTGESSDRDDSDEVDRQQLGLVADAKAKRGRNWRRWLFIYTLIAIGFAMLVLVAWKLSKARKSPPKQAFVSNGTALFAPTTLILSLDGFRADFLQRGITPRLNAFIEEGVSPKYMLPSFPSVTFPNHYTLATGLYPESHGVVGNTFWDPNIQAEFYYTDPARSLDPKWWGGEPFWVTAENQGIRSAIHMWPGSEAHVMDVEPSFLDKFNGKEALGNKVARIFEFLDKPGKEDESVDVKHMRPQVIAAYVPNVDSGGHKYGPNSTEIREIIQNVDSMVDEIFQGLEDRNLTKIVNVIVVSDHGMATTDITRLIQLEDIIDTSKLEHIDGWPLYGLRPKNPDDLQGLYEELLAHAKTNSNIEVYLRDVNMPERYHFSNNDRIAPLWIVPKTGWAIVTKDEFDMAEGKEKGLVYHPRGLHGYDHEHPLMRAIFVARGPAFPHPANSQIDVFQNTEVYNILCDSVGIDPRPNNGTLRLPLKPVGLHKPDETPETPADPPEPSPKPPKPPSPEAPEPPSPEPPRPVKPSKEPPRPTLPEEPSEPARPTVPTGSVDDKPADEPPKDSKPDDKNKSDESGDKDDETDEGEDRGFWGWLTGKVGTIWDKITGANSDSSDSKGSRSRIV